VILEAGEGVPSEAMEPIRSATRRTFAFALRSGQHGESGAAPTPRAADDTTADLHGLLEAAEVPGPMSLWVTRQAACLCRPTPAGTQTRSPALWR
jgi:hypothetical protein